ncbi:MAG: hypothetical protein PHG66_06275 [Candidatus Colwellbacteria bacterium]|nr:hypothetical protein [Candidatus Colwellbacteria bacterium]
MSDAENEVQSPASESPEVKEEPTKKEKEEVPTHDLKTKCNYILKQGARKGQYCKSKKNVDSKLYCTVHNKIIGEKLLKVAPKKEMVKKIKDKLVVVAKGKSSKSKGSRGPSKPESEDDGEDIEIGSDDSDEEELVINAPTEEEESESEEESKQESELESESESESEEEYIVKRKPTRKAPIRQPKEPKVRQPKTRQPKEPKPKKLTKKEEKLLRMEEKGSMIGRGSSTIPEQPLNLQMFGIGGERPDIRSVPSQELSRALKNMRY